MKIYFSNAEQVQNGIALLANDLGIQISDAKEADIAVDIVESKEQILKVSLNGSAASITYGHGKARCFRGLATLVGLVSRGQTSAEVIEHPLFKTNGAMVDMSRNAVMNLKTVKTMLRKIALMGLNTFMLYTEDTYEIEEYPYFGYMRGRYTKEEIRELDAYALTLGIELVPCIQTLGHLATHLRWDAAAPYKDTASALLAESEKTYDLIEAMLRTTAECFTTRRIHVGMDETYDLGTGKYLTKFGYKDRREIYFAHLQRVIELCQKHGFSPMMWSDMFFRLAGKDIPRYYDYHPDVQFSEEVKAKIPQGIRQVFWDYYRPSEEFYLTNIEKHHDIFGPDTIFAGGIWLWSGPCPLFSRSLAFTLPALRACKKKGVEDVFATIWLNGGESFQLLALAGLAWYADYDYKGEYNEQSVKDCFAFSCGMDYDEIIQCELPERPLCPGDNQLLSLARAYLYNDPLIGLIDKHIEGDEVQSYLKAATKALMSAKTDKKELTPAYDFIIHVSSVLENKADYGIRLKAAYDQKDKEMLANLLSECDEIIEKLQNLRKSHRAAWFEYNKPFGWEVHDIRYGGLIARFDTVKERLAAYLNGDIEHIEELEQERLRIDGLPEDTSPRYTQKFLWMKYQTLTTPHTI